MPSVIKDIMYASSKMMLLLVIVINIGLSCSLVPPKYLWPLGRDSFTYDVTHDQMGLFPNTTECFPVGPKHPGLSYSSMFFDKNRTKYVDVRIPENSSMLDFGMSLFIYPQTETGIILHYLSDDRFPNYNYITDLQMVVHNGNVKMIISHGGGAPSWNLGPYLFDNSKWAMVALVKDATTNKLYLYVNDLKENVSHWIDNVTLQLPGTLRFGDYQPIYPPYGYYGYMTAAALYNTSNDIGNIPDLLQHARKSNWPSAPPVPACPDRTLEDVDINHLWPLDDTGLTIDIKTHQDDQNNHCFRFGQIHPTLPNRAIYIDGSPFSSINLKIKGSEIDKSFTLAVNVFILGETSGSLMKITNIQGQTIFEVVITGRNVELNAFTNTNINCGSVIITDIVSTNNWYVVGIHRDVESNSTGLLVDNTVNSTSDMCGLFGMVDDLLVQIGSSDHHLPGYRSDVRCLVLFNNPGFDIKISVQDACVDAHSVFPTGLVKNCMLVDLSNSYHHLLKSVYPSDSCSPLAIYTTRSVIECGIRCYHHVLCRSFVYFSNQCLVYDLVTATGLIPSPGARYYIVDRGIIIDSLKGL